MGKQQAALHWEPEVLEQKLDPEFYYRSCPPQATVPGVFMQDVANLVLSSNPAAAHRLYDQISERRWIAFKSFPLRDFIRLATNASQVLYDAVPLSEGLRRLGRIAYPCLSRTMAGRVVLFAFGNRLEDALRNAAKAYKIVLPEAAVTADIEEGHGRIELRNVYNFATAYHYGVLEGTIAATGHKPTIHVVPGQRWCDATYDLRWA